MAAAQTESVVQQAFFQAQQGTLPADLFFMLIDKFMIASNKTVAKELLNTWEKNLPGAAVLSSADQKKLDQVKAQLSG